MDGAVELADVIGQLRHELSRAMWAGEHSDLRFEAESVELELVVAVERAREPRAAVRFWVLDVGADLRRSSIVTQRLTLTLRPRHAGDPDGPVAIDGTPMTDER